MASGAAELEAFKTDINLVDYLASEGFSLDARESSTGCKVMHAPSGLTVKIMRKPNGHYVYNANTGDDAGTIIDYVQKHKGLNIGQVRQELRAWTNSFPYRPAVQHTAPPRQEIDIEGVRRLFNLMKPGTPHEYLTGRGIPEDVQTSSRFSGSIYRDHKFNNAIFPHYNRDGLSGFEIKNKNFTGFPKGGLKGLWRSTVNKQDTRAVFAETAIDALSYACLFDDGHTRYFSTAGGFSDLQADLIASAAAKLPEGGQIIIAADHDQGGDKFTERLQAALEQAGRNDLKVTRHSPEAEGSDWNNELNLGQ